MWLLLLSIDVNLEKRRGANGVGQHGTRMTCGGGKCCIDCAQRLGGGGEFPFLPNKPSDNPSKTTITRHYYFTHWNCTTYLPSGPKLTLPINFQNFSRNTICKILLSHWLCPCLVRWSLPFGARNYPLSSNATLSPILLIPTSLQTLSLLYQS